MADDTSLQAQDLSRQTAIAPSASLTIVPPSPVRAWFYLIWLSFQRQARAHLMVWIALGLLAFSVFIVFLNTQLDRWNTSYWRSPRRGGPTYAEYLETVEKVGHLPLDPATRSIHFAVYSAQSTVVNEASGFMVFSRGVAFTIFATFLLPLWCLSFATEGLGREREARNLIWLLIRPLPRWSIFLGKFLALLPWCLVLNLGGFWLICLAAPGPGTLAFRLYWPAVVWATLAFAALFHLMGAIFQRAAVVAILYSFFIETILGNLPGHMKRLSLNFYTNCLMFERAHDFGVRPERPQIYLPVSGTIACWVLIGVTATTLALGMYLFSRREYLDLTG
jgi:ABC-2 type transport system permease protein